MGPERARAVALGIALALALPGCRPRGDVGILPYYPGAQLVSVGEFQGEAFGFGPARWKRATLVARAPFDRVRDFYARIAPRGATSALVNESRKSMGRRYDRYLSDGRRREFYAIQITEEGGGSVRILLAYAQRGGVSPPP